MARFEIAYSMEIASVGQASTQAPHSLHVSSSTTAVPSVTSIASSGHESTQSPHPVHLSLSIAAAIFMLLVLYLTDTKNYPRGGQIFQKVQYRPRIQTLDQSSKAPIEKGETLYLDDRIGIKSQIPPIYSGMETPGSTNSPRRQASRNSKLLGKESGKTAISADVTQWIDATSLGLGAISSSSGISTVHQ
jgi:hypothetical protein